MTTRIEDERRAAPAIARLEAALAEAAGTAVALERPGEAAHGDYATNIALRLAGARKQPPRAIAEELAAQAAALPGVERAEVAGPGFVNLWLAPAWYGDALAEVLDAGDRYGADSAAARERVQVEMVSANPTGPITVASARNGAYGDSVARLLAFAGHEVEREYYYNDAGAQMEKFRDSVEAIRRGEERAHTAPSFSNVSSRGRNSPIRCSSALCSAHESKWIRKRSIVASIRFNICGTGSSGS